MGRKKKKLGAFVVPTGVGASIGGFAGDASFWAREFSKHCNLIVNPNVVNAGCFSGITENMLYVEGYTLDEFFKGKISLIPCQNNKIGVVFDKSISQEVLNIHINTINAVKTVYGLDILGYEITEENVGVDFFVDKSNISTGSVKNLKTLLNSARKLIKKGANAIAIVCRFKDDKINENYQNGIGVDPIGGVEAIISHYISRELKIPAAHSPAFDDFSISTEVVDARASAEYITPTFLPCVLLGLANAPQICKFSPKKLNINDLDFLIMPYNCLGSIPVFESIKRKIKIYAIKENSTLLNVKKEILFKNSDIIEIENYKKCLELIK
ncbi:MAG TPA: DUF3326 domain-containing protein [Candidatus Gastranaerophilaceae bacterium]|nr:DUF3326 domain-containing protein [Candidatus Gastranaerophilaceae bacterium]